VQDALRLSMGADHLPGFAREQGAPADRLRTRGVALVAVVQIGLDERHADVPRLRVGQEGADM
jgi:hypothetical protein